MQFGHADCRRRDLRVGQQFARDFVAPRALDFVATPAHVVTRRDLATRDDFLTSGVEERGARLLVPAVVGVRDDVEDLVGGVRAEPRVDVAPQQPPPAAAHAHASAHSPRRRHGGHVIQRRTTSGNRIGSP